MIQEFDKEQAREEKRKAKKLENKIQQARLNIKM